MSQLFTTRIAALVVFTALLMGSFSVAFANTQSQYGATDATQAYAYVSLAQIPYTGFDMGPVGNSIYWAGMMLISLIGAYFIVYGYSGAQPRAFAREVVQAARNQIKTVRSIVE